MLCSNLGVGSRVGQLWLAVQGQTSAIAFTFDGPVASSAQFGLDQQHNIARSDYAVLTIQGLNFAVDDPTPSQRQSATACLTTSWSSGTAVKCHNKEVNAVGWSYVTSVTIDGLFTTIVKSVFSFDAPVATYHVLNIPTSGSCILQYQ